MKPAGWSQGLDQSCHWRHQGHFFWEFRGFANFPTILFFLLLLKQHLALQNEKYTYKNIYKNHRKGYFISKIWRGWGSTWKDFRSYLSFHNWEVYSWGTFENTHVEFISPFYVFILISVRVVRLIVCLCFLLVFGENLRTCSPISSSRFYFFVCLINKWISKKNINKEKTWDSVFVGYFKVSFTLQRISAPSLLSSRHQQSAKLTRNFFQLFLSLASWLTFKQRWRGVGVAGWGA